jgi:hypothetical protein
MRGNDVEMRFDRHGQVLPIPIAGLTPAHSRVHVLRRIWRRWQPVCLTVAGLISAGLGVVVGTSPMTIEVYGDASAIHIGSSVLQRAGTPAVLGSRLYVGDASIVMVPDQHGWRAAGVTTVDGKAARGTCRFEETANGAAESCVFTLGVQTLKATDAFDASNGRWRREYVDGVTVIFRVPSQYGPVPIPIPLGHS